MPAAPPPADIAGDADNLPPIPKPTAETRAAAARLGVSADDLALIEAEHGVQDAGVLLKLAVNEYANLLRRRGLSNIAGQIRFAFEPRRRGGFDENGFDDGEEDDIAIDRTRADEPAVAA